MKHIFLFFLSSLIIFSCGNNSTDSAPSKTNDKEEKVNEDEKLLLSKSLSNLVVKNVITVDSSASISLKYAELSSKNKEEATKFVEYWVEISNSNNDAKSNDLGLIDIEFQSNFLDTKTNEFKKQIEDKDDANEIKVKQNELTNALIAQYKNEISNWTGTIIWVDQFNGKDVDIAISLLERKIIGTKSINGKTMDCGITIEVSQEKGIKREGELYNKIKGLKQGDRIVFSAEIVSTNDVTEKNGLNLVTTLSIKLKKIEKQ